MIKGIAAVVLASIALGLIPSLTKITLNMNISPDSLIFYRFAFSAFFMMLLTLAQKHSFRVSKRQLWQLIVFGVLGSGLTGVFLTWSLIYIPTGLSTMFHFSYPIIVILFMAVIYKERITRQKVAAVLLAVAGLVLMMKPAGGIRAAGVILSLLSGVTYATYVIAGKKASFSCLPSAVIVFYVSGFCAIFLGILAAVSGTLNFPLEPAPWLCLSLAALISSVFGLCMLFTGIKILGASNSAVLNMLEPVTAVLAGIFFFRESLPFTTVVGCACIITSAVMVSRESRNMEQIQKEEENASQEQTNIK